jgi:hypothetical protein
MGHTSGFYPRHPPLHKSIVASNGLSSLSVAHVQGMGRGTRGGGSQGAGHNYVDNPCGSYAGRDVGGRGGMRMNMDMMSGGMSQGHVRVTSNGLRY